MKNIDKKKLIDYFTTNNKSGYKTKESHIIKNFEGLIEVINEYNNVYFNSELPFTQKLYNYLYDIIEIPRCDNCSNPIKWRGIFTEGYLKNCSKECKNNSKLRIERTKATNLKKYGVDSVLKVNKFKEKRNKTIKDKYGVENMFEHEDIKEKTKATNLKKYGTEHAIQSDIIKKRRKNNNIIKYGVNSPSKLDYVKEKLKNTVLKKYHVDSVMKVNEFKNKQIITSTKNNFEKYKKLLGENVSFINECKNLIILNQCSIHKKYTISRNLFYYRCLVYKHENPCIICNPISENISIKEIELRKYIENTFNFNINKIRIENKEIDIYIPEHKLGIEFDGLYWHSNIYKDKKYHLNKTELCKKQEIQLLHIFEDEWIFKKEIVKSIIKSKLGIIENKIFARKCQIKEVDNKTSLKFLEFNHIQGNINSKIKIGLFYNDELISIMIFGKKRLALGNKINIKNEYEMLRFCNKLNTQVIGGAGKLLNYFIKKYNPKSILTFADRRYSNGNLYRQLGFEFISNTKPNYWYFKRKELIRYHRFKYRKDVLVKEGFDSNKTENEIMLERGYLRIFDCGNMKFEMKFN
jgi:hypothetical protein